MKKTLIAASVLALGFSSAPVLAATTYTENFNQPFPTWESGWFGQQTNAQNCYGVGADRGNNPDGLWIASATSTGCGTAPVTVKFNAPFASSLTSFSLDVASYVSSTLAFYDASGNLISSTAVFDTFGAMSTPGVYAHYSVSSLTGIGGFSFSGNATGNTSIDNLVAIAGVAGAVPEPATWAMMLAGFGMVGFAARRRASVKTTVTFA